MSLFRDGPLRRQNGSVRFVRMASLGLALAAILFVASGATLWHTDAPGALATCPICHLAHMPALRGMPAGIVITRVIFARVALADSQPIYTRTHERNSPPRAPPA
jgi:hypothetical protein